MYVLEAPSSLAPTFQLARCPNHKHKNSHFSPTDPCLSTPLGSAAEALAGPLLSTSLGTAGKAQVAPNARCAPARLRRLSYRSSSLSLNTLQLQPKGSNDR